MFGIPPIPSWDALHPSISHFPIALLLVVPIFLILALLLRERRAVLRVIAFGLLAAGTAGVFVAASTGDEAKLLAPQTAEVKAALDAHEELGSTARAIFSGLTVVLAALLWGPRWLKRALSDRAATALMVAFLALYVAAALVLVNTAHSGGLLVHKLGVHGKIT